LTALGRASLVYCDNVNAMYLSTDPVQHQRTKHVAIDLHFVRNQVAIGDIRVLHVPSTSQFADIFTKGLLSSTFSEFRYSQWLVVVAGALCVLGYFFVVQSCTPCTTTILPTLLGLE
jgi:hypothetical protein